MTHEEFAAMVGRLEGFARREPSKYALRVGLLAALGYGYILLVLSLCFLLVYALVYLGSVNWVVVKVGWVVLTFAALVIRAMWVRVPPPEGFEVTRETAPRLFALVEELTGRLQAPRIHRVLVDGDFNAGVAQVPRLGPLGWHRNYLVLGLPLMQALSPEQFRAVLAHELGHLSGNHGRFSSRIYGVRQMWFQLLARLQAEDRWGSAVFVKFFNWYAPYFNAYSFVLARQHEYDADRAAAELTSPRTAAEALVVVDVQGSRLSEEFWPEVFKQADESREPAGGAYLSLSTFLREPVAAAGAGFLRRSLAQETGYDDTHPSLSSRLSALGVIPADGAGAVGEWADRQQFETPPESAAVHYFGPAQGQLAERIEAVWREAVAPHWRERHEYAVQSRRRLAELDEKAAAGRRLSLEELWQRAYWTAEFVGAEASEPRLRELLEGHPDHAQANLALGQMLLERGDEAGVAHLERAMESEPGAIVAGCEMLYGYMRERGREEEAEVYRKRLLRHYDALELARDERNMYKDGDELLPHELSAEQVEGIRAQLRHYDRIERAYLARKYVEHFTTKPVYVLAVETSARWYRLGSGEADAELLRALSHRMEMPGESFFVVLNGKFRQTRKRLQTMDGALVYGG